MEKLKETINKCRVNAAAVPGLVQNLLTQGTVNGYVYQFSVRSSFLVPFSVPKSGLLVAESQKTIKNKWWQYHDGANGAKVYYNALKIIKVVE